MTVNKLYYGDCLSIMQDMPLASVDLIYLDPPFNSNRTYNAIYQDETGRPLPDQIEAFCDMWELDPERERAIRTMPVLMRENGIDDATAELWRLWMQALRGTQPRLLAYLSYMAERLIIMHRILKPTGSLYYHCDPTASHYVKALLDAIFGHGNFRSEIHWYYYNKMHDRRKKLFAAATDTILFYAKNSKAAFTFHQLTEQREKPVRQLKRKKVNGRMVNARDADGNVMYQVRTERTIDNVWRIPALQPASQERMGYATQKPLALMERIISASSNPGDVVLDPFAGCATTLEAAHKLGRQWIGIDIAIHAVKRVARVRLTERLGLIEGQDFTVEGVPRTVEGAHDLWTRDKYHFQKWAVEQVDGFVTTKRSADGGIDGRVYYAVPHAQDLQSMVIEVKGGANVNIRDLRALKGVLDYDTALMAGLITMEPLGTTKARNFTRFTADAGSMEILGIEYPRMQMLTVAEILDGKRFKTPTVQGRHELEPRFPGIPAVGA